MTALQMKTYNINQISHMHTPASNIIHSLPTPPTAPKTQDEKIYKIKNIKNTHTGSGKNLSIFKVPLHDYISLVCNEKCIVFTHYYIIFMVHKLEKLLKQYN